MLYPFSDNLTKVLDFNNSGLNQEVELSSFCNRIVALLEANKSIATECFKLVNGKVRAVTIGSYLVRMLQFDSAVRDIQTTGHLGKLLSRFHYFEKSKSFELLGLPHVLFDAISQQERASFFKRGQVLFADGMVLEIPEVQDMLNREREILRNFKTAEPHTPTNT